MSTFDDLRRVVKGGRLHEIQGFGPTIEKKLIAALEKPTLRDYPWRRSRAPPATRFALSGQPRAIK